MKRVTFLGTAAAALAATTVPLSVSATAPVSPILSTFAAEIYKYHYVPQGYLARFSLVHGNQGPLIPKFIRLEDFNVNQKLVLNLKNPAPEPGYREFAVPFFGIGEEGVLPWKNRNQGKNPSPAMVKKIMNKLFFDNLEAGASNLGKFKSFNEAYEAGEADDKIGLVGLQILAHSNSYFRFMTSFRPGQYCFFDEIPDNTVYFLPKPEAAGVVIETMDELGHPAYGLCSTHCWRATIV